MDNIGLFYAFFPIFIDLHFQLCKIVGFQYFVFVFINLNVHSGGELGGCQTIGGLDYSYLMTVDSVCVLMVKLTLINIYQEKINSSKPTYA